MSETNKIFGEPKAAFGPSLPPIASAFSTPPMFQKIWQLLFGSIRIWSDARASQMAAALTYYAMLSLAPTLMIAIAIAGYLFDDRLAEAEILSVVKQFTTPEIAQTISGLIQRASGPQSGIFASAISVGVLVIGASGVFSQLYDTFNYIWHVDGKKIGFWFAVRKRGIGISMVLIIGLMLIGALVLNSTLAYVTQQMEGHPILISWLHFADRSLSFLLLPIVFSTLFWFVPSVKLQLWDVLPAGVVTAVLMAGNRYIIQLYLQFSSTSEVYGAAGSLVVLLIWIYMTSMVVFYGASFSHAWAITYGSRTPEKLAATPNVESIEHENVEQLVPERRQKPSNELA
jgi:membrane protein